ncbi:uncharacterized protein [Dermacentor albipictus]
MTERDLLSISSYVFQVPPKELGSIEWKHAEWLPRLKGATSWQAATAIRDALRAIDEPTERLRRAARLSGLLIPHDTLGRWSLYLHRDFAKHQSAIRVFQSVAYALGSDTRTIGRDRKNTCCSCIMVEDPKSAEGDHNYACLYVWNAMPFLAVHVTGDKFEPVVDAAVGAVMGTASRNIRVGTYPSLDAAFARARIYMEPAVPSENPEEDGTERWLGASPDRCDDSSGNQTGSDDEVQESSCLGLEAVLRMLLPPCNSEDWLDGVRKKSRSIYEDITSDYSSSPSSVTSRQSSPKQEDLGVYQGKSKQQIQGTTSCRGDQGADEGQAKKLLCCRDCNACDIDCSSGALQLNTDALNTW